MVDRYLSFHASLWRARAHTGWIVLYSTQRQFIETIARSGPIAMVIAAFNRNMPFRPVRHGNRLPANLPNATL